MAHLPSAVVFRSFLAVRRRRAHRPRPGWPLGSAGLAAALGSLLVVSPALAQLRPLPTAAWDGDGHSVACGGGVYEEMGAGLLGAYGTLTELGDCKAVVDLGRARIQFAGTARRTFTITSTFRDPAAGVEGETGPTRRDWGDFVLETLIPIGLPWEPWQAGLRFGARYPTTDNKVGLDRDQTDVHVAAMGGYMGGALNGSLELGVGINGSRSQALEQQDVLTYAAALSYGGRAARARIGVVGHTFWTNDWSARGNEDRGEIRVGGRLGSRTWVDVDLVFGFEELGPTRGLRIRLGRSWPGPESSGAPGDR